MRCLIVEDEQMSRAHLAHLCKRIDQLEIVRVFDNALDAYHFLEEHEVDLVFLDVEMPDFTGIELVQQLSNPPAVIFTTSKADYAAKAFEFIELVADYLLKPITLPRLLKAIRRVQAQPLAVVHKASGLPMPDADTLPSTATATPLQPRMTDQHIFVKTERKYVRIDLRELLYVETVGDYSIFKTATGQHTVHATLKSIGERLPNPQFFKVHRSYIVNIAKIKDIEDSNLLIEDKIIPISRTQRPELMERICPL